MKILATAAACAAMMIGAAPGMVTPAAAQRTVVHERTVVRGPVRHHAHSRRVCRMEYRHHHRVRVCRTVRYR